MWRWLLLSRYHWTVVFALLALSAALVAWNSFGLINLTMANFEFLSRYRWQALREGGLLQLLQIGGQAGLVLVTYLLFKACETEIIHRWRALDK